MKKAEKSKKKVVQIDEFGRACITTSFNNIIISMTNQQGQVVTWSSAGKMGFKGSKKNTPYAAQCTAIDCAKKAHELGMKKVNVYLKGPGGGKEAAVRTIQNVGIDIVMIKDITPVPHNGCRPPKRRRPSKIIL